MIKGVPLKDERKKTEGKDDAIKDSRAYWYV